MTLSANPPQVVHIEDQMRSSYIEYAMSVIISRALPDVRDGLKPVQRRILYAMHDMGIRHATQPRKCARIVGEVLGKYHPHGDSSVYDALVRMAQPFTMRAPLVDGQGNFGSVDNDPAAAMRYTEARLTDAAETMLADITEETVAFRENFDATNQEPTVLPNRIPNLLINGATGIAVGMATNMPPHNPTEVCDAVIKMIDHPDSTISDLMAIMPGPDLPTYATIRGTSGIRDMYETGRGKIVMEAVAEIEESRNHRQRIIITELPYQTVKSNLVEKIADLVKAKTILGITEIRDESDRKGTRVVIELSRDAQANVVLNNLYQRTAMRSNFNAIMLALVDSEPKELTLREILQHFINHRSDVIRNRSKYRLQRSKDRIHIVEGLLSALNNIDPIIQTIRASNDNESAKSALIQTFQLTDAQAQAILDMQLRRLSALETNRLDEERKTLAQTIKELEELLDDQAIVLARVRAQTVEVKKTIRQPRRTLIISNAIQETTIEDLVVQEDVVVSLSQRGYLKRLPLNTYRAQRKGGKGVQNTNREDDPTTHLEVVSTHDQLLFFTSQGRMHSLEVHKLPSETSRTNLGTLLINLLSLNPNERIRTMSRLDKQKPENLHLFMTRQGRIAAIQSTDIASTRANKTGVIKILDDDELIQVKTAQGDNSVIIVTKNGKTVVFPISDIPIHKKGTRGVQAIHTDPSDPVVAMDIISNPNQYVILATTNGYAKATPISSHPTMRRGRRGRNAYKTDQETGHIADAQVVDPEAFNSDDHEMFIISAKGQISRINLSEVRIVNTRYTKGVIAWRQGQPDDQITAITCFKVLQPAEAPQENERSQATDQPEQAALFKN